MATKAKTVTVTTATGDEVEVPVGVDGKNPVSPSNPSPKALSEEDREAAVEAAKEQAKADAELVKAAASDNK